MDFTINHAYSVLYNHSGFNLCDVDEGGEVREGLSWYTCLLMLMKLCPGYWENKLEGMNVRVDEDNGRATGTRKLRNSKVQQFLRNEFQKNIGCLVSDHTFSIGGLRIWDNK